MASIVFSSIGSSLGNALLPGVGGRVLGALGRKLGSPLDEAIGWSEEGSASGGSRLENFKVQDSRYGMAVPLPFGAVRVAGNVIWMSPLIETVQRENAGIGKGGGTFSGSSTTRYSYSVHVAVALGEGPAEAVRTIWADNKIIYQDGVWADGVVGAATLYKGLEGQEVDPLIESLQGSGNVPAYPSLAYMVFESLQLASFGNRLPNLTFEIVSRSADLEPAVSGSAEAGYLSSGVSVAGGGMTPIAVQVSSARVRSVLCGGYERAAQEEGGGVRFLAREVSVEGGELGEVRRVLSGAFALSDAGALSWSADESGRYVAFALQDNDAARSLYVALYDAQSGAFGAVQAFAMGEGSNKSVAWLDPLRFVVVDRVSGVRGVRVFMRAGLGVVSLGFFDVWGSAARYATNFAHFVPVTGGLLCVAANNAGSFSQLYARLLVWQEGGVRVGAAAALGGSVALGGNVGVLRFVSLGEGAWAAFWQAGRQMRLMSFLALPEGASIVRPWQAFTLPANVTGSSAWVQGEALQFAMRPYYGGAFELYEVGLESRGFGALSQARVLAGQYDPPSDFSALKLGGGRVFIEGCASDGVVTASYAAAVGVAVCDLAQAVGTLLARAGYEAADYDVEALRGISLDGFVLGDGDTLISALGWLQAFEPFDLVEREGRLVAWRRSGEVAAVLDEDDLGAGDEGGSALEVSRARELSLPVELTLDTIEADRDYEVGTQRARRLVAGGGARALQVSLPLVCSPGAAKRLAERMLYALWSERVGYAFSLPYTYGWLQAGDVVEVLGHRVRIMQMERRKGVWQVSGVSSLADGVASVALGQKGEGASSREGGAVESRLYLMDLPALRTSDDEAGFYVAVSGGAAWRGASLWRSADGVDFLQKAGFSVAASAGCVVEVPVAKTFHYKDMESVLKVQLYNGSLASCSSFQLLGGANVALCGGEILQFESAVLVGPQLYELRGLLRGRLGTQEAVSSHLVGEDFILLNEGAVQFVPCALEERGRAYHYRAVSKGGSLGFARDVVLAAGLRSLRPLAPAHLRGAWAGGDCSLSWVRCARVNGGWCDYVDVPLDAARELYDVEILDEAGAVKRSFLDLQEGAVLYARAGQIEDFGAAQEQVRVRVYQKNERYGRGAALEGRV